MPALSTFERFDIESVGPVIKDEHGMLESSAQVNNLIANEISSGTPADRIVLGGLSQGGTLTLLPGLTSETKLAGLIVLSGRLVMREKIKAVRATLLVYLVVELYEKGI